MSVAGDWAKLDDTAMQQAKHTPTLAAATWRRQTDFVITIFPVAFELYGSRRFAISRIKTIDVPSDDML